MNKEKVLISISAVVVGSLVAIGALFLYQSTKKISKSEVKSISVSSPTPTPASGLFLTIDSPIDEEIVETRLVEVSGQTIPGTKLIILTSTDEVSAVPTDDGKFSTEVSITSNENIIEIVAIAPNGESVRARRVVSFTTEDF